MGSWEYSLPTLRVTRNGSKFFFFFVNGQCLVLFSLSRPSPPVIASFKYCFLSIFNGSMSRQWIGTVRRKGCGRRQQWSMQRYYSGMCIQELLESMHDPNHQDRDSKHVRLKCKTSNQASSYFLKLTTLRLCLSLSSLFYLCSTGDCILLSIYSLQAN